MILQRLLETLKTEEVRITDPFSGVNGIVSDSRQTKKGDIFVCLRGRKTDGHDHAFDAFVSGASLIVCEEVPPGLPETASFARVNDSRLALALLCDAFYGHPSEKLRVVGVTGTNGKTSTVEILRSLFSFSGIRTERIGTLDGEMTTPDCEELYRRLAAYAGEGIDTVFMEVSSHALALRKVDAIGFSLGIFTNLTPEHLDFHADMDAYAAAKARLFSLSESALLNADDPYAGRMAKGAGQTYTYSASARAADFTAKCVCESERGGTSFRWFHPDGMECVRTPLFGEINVSNALAAASAARLLGLSPDGIREGLSHLPPIRGRMEKLPLDAPFSVYIDFAHTPDALEKVLLALLKNRKKGRKLILLFGCGGDRDRKKRAEMGRIASRYADYSVITGDNSRSEPIGVILDEILRGVDKESRYRVIPDRREAIGYALSLAGEGDIVLLAGKGHEEYEINAEGKKRFSEREIVSEYLKNAH